MRRCLLEPSHECPAEEDAERKCVCVPPGFDAAEWRSLTPDERKALYNGAGEALVVAVRTVLARGLKHESVESGEGRS